MSQKAEFYRKIIEIMDSQDQEQERRAQEEKRSIKISSEIKQKPERTARSQIDQEWSNHSCIQLQNKRNGISFLDVQNYAQVEITSSFYNFLGSFRNFIEFSQKNILFIFGPSGCGKTLLTLNILNQSNLPYELLQGNTWIDDHTGEVEYEEDIELLYRKFASNARVWQTIYISKDFPKDYNEMSQAYSKKYKLFKQKIYDVIGDMDNKNKYIFILNSEIYSSYYLLSQASESRSISKLKNVSVIKMEPYGVTDMKKIIKGFTERFYQYSNVIKYPKSLDEIVTEAGGDARKALNIIYYRKISEIAYLNPYNNPNNSRKINFYDAEPNNKGKQTTKMRQLCTRNQKQILEKQQPKVGIFHALGKFLYGKRKNIDYVPNKKGGKSNKISRFYTQKEIQLYNPKFYFKPVELFERSHMNLSVFVDLLEQNFLNRYGKVRDIMKMYNIFRFYDSYLDETLNKYAIKEQMQKHMTELITWGIILYNRNSIQNNSFVSFQRPRNNIHKKILEKKWELIKSHYLRLKDTTSTIKYNKNDIVLFGYFLQCNPRRINLNNFYLQKLIEIIFDNGRKSNYIIGSTVQKEVSVIEENEQEVGFENCGKLNQISEQMILEIRKKGIIDQMLNEDSDASDIDSD